MADFKELWDRLGDTKVSFAIWCSGCNAEPAVDEVEAEINGQWMKIDVGEKCLTRLREAGRIE